MRVAVYGAGAMGTSLGALLKEAGIEPVLITRNQAHVSAIQANGAKILTPSGEKTVCMQAITPETMYERLRNDASERYDLIFLTTKQRNNAEIARFLKDYLWDWGVLVTAQNGLPEEELAQIIGEENVGGCVLSWGAELVEPGVVQITSEEGYHLQFGKYVPTGSVSLEGLSGQLSRLDGVTALYYDSISEVRYAKLAISASFSTLSTITGLTFYELAKKYKKQVLALMREVFAVAKAADCKKLPLHGKDIMALFSAWYAPVILPVAMKKYKETRSGMLLDLQKGTRCDIDFISGAVVRAAQKYGVETPLQERAVALVHEIENGLAEIAPETLQLLYV